MRRWGQTFALLEIPLLIAEGIAGLRGETARAGLFMWAVFIAATLALIFLWADKAPLVRRVRRRLGHAFGRVDAATPGAWLCPLCHHYRTTPYCDMHGGAGVRGGMIVIRRPQDPPPKSAPPVPPGRR